MEKKGFRDRVAGWCGFSRAETGVLKGLAILMMIAHHLYIMMGVSIDESLRYSYDVFRIAFHGKACVLLFGFVTGYGYRYVAARDRQHCLKSIWGRLKRFYPQFLAMLAVTTFLLGCFGHLQTSHLDGYTGSWKGYLLCATGLVEVYLDYWYIGVFLCAAIVIYPMMRWGMQHGALAEAIVFTLFVAFSWCEPMLQGMVSKMGAYASDGGAAALRDMLMASPWQASLHWICGILLGWACAAVYSERSGQAWFLMILVSVFCVVIHWKFLPPMLLCLVAAKVASRSGMACAVLGKLGALSAAMWLNHRLIFGYWFADFFYAVPAPLNFLLLVALSALAAQVFVWVYAWVGDKLAHILASLGGRRRERGETRP